MGKRELNRVRKIAFARDSSILEEAFRPVAARKLIAELNDRGN